MPYNIFLYLFQLFNYFNLSPSRDILSCDNRQSQCKQGGIPRIVGKILPTTR